MKSIVLISMIAITASFDSIPHRSGRYITPSDSILQVGDAMIIQNLYFDFDKSSIRELSFGVLDTLAVFINSNDSLSFEIGVHMDPVGKESYNQTLSESRAQNAYDYLVNNGVDSHKLTCRGYGSSVLLPITCEPCEPKVMHRRAELLVTGKTNR